MMKTKLTLFVAVFAVALFGMGCASVPKGPPVPHAVQWNGHWYAYILEPVTWDAARKRCIELGGHLVIIESEEENEFVHQLGLKERKGTVHAWIGACDSRNDSKNKADRVFKWVSPNGKNLSETYTNWRADVFDNPFGGIGLAPVEIDIISHKEPNHKKWGYRSETYRTVFICEWE